jgi:hypothetical protein
MSIPSLVLYKKEQAPDFLPEPVKFASYSSRLIYLTRCPFTAGVLFLRSSETFARSPLIFKRIIVSCFYLSPPLTSEEP